LIPVIKGKSDTIYFYSVTESTRKTRRYGSKPIIWFALSRVPVNLMSFCFLLCFAAAFPKASRIGLLFFSLVLSKQDKMKRPGYPVFGERWDFIEYRKDQ
jgi:hypothetical protein